MTNKMNFPTIAEIKANQPAVNSTDVLDQVMSVSEVAAVFNVPQPTVNKDIQRKNIPARKSGKIWIVRRVDAVAKYASRGAARGTLLIAASIGFAGLLVTLASIAQ